MKHKYILMLLFVAQIFSMGDRVQYSRPNTYFLNHSKISRTIFENSDKSADLIRTLKAKLPEGALSDNFIRVTNLDDKSFIIFSLYGSPVGVVPAEILAGMGQRVEFENKKLSQALSTPLQAREDLNVAHAVLPSGKQLFVIPGNTSTNLSELIPFSNHR